MNKIYILLLLVFCSCNIDAETKVYSVEIVNQKEIISLGQNFEEATTLLGDPQDIRRKTIGSLTSIRYIYKGIELNTFEKSEIIQSIVVRENNVMVLDKFKIGDSIDTIIDAYNSDLSIQKFDYKDRKSFTLLFNNIQVDGNQEVNPWISFHYNEKGIVEIIQLGHTAL